jgi:SOS-response transcriptional repressor LexA
MGFLLSLCGASAAGDAAGLGVVKGSQILQVNTSTSVDTIRGYTTAATYYVRLSGDSMKGAGLYGGDILVVDRSLEPKHNDIVIAVLDGELTVKRLYRQGSLVRLRPANPRYPIITIHADQELLIWGVVTGSIRQFNR